MTQMSMATAFIASLGGFIDRRQISVSAVNRRRLSGSCKRQYRRVLYQALRQSSLSKRINGVVA
jgi:hypothetical protein